MLYHLLPVAFWLLALGAIVLWEIIFNYQFSIINYAVPALSLLSAAIIRRIPRHTESVEQCFVVALLLGIAAYWLPTVVGLILPIWFYLIYQNLFSLRSFLSSLLGFACVGLWFFVLSFSPFPFTIHHSPFTIHPFTHSSLHLWLPTASVLLAWLLTVLVRKHLRVR